MELCGIKSAADIVPIESANQPLISVAHFLASDLERDREFLEVAYDSISLMQIHRAIRLRIGIAIVARRVAATTFEKQLKPLGIVTDVRRHALFLDRVISIGREGFKIVGARRRTG